MNKLRKILLLILSLLALPMQAQELTVKEIKPAPMDLSASQYERKDLAGKPCALVKVQLAALGAQFEGNVIGKSENKTGEYWVYMSEGSYMLSVKHPNFVPLNVNFRDYGISGVAGKTTYVLTLLMSDQKMQKLTINYTPSTAMVIVDSKVYRGNGRVELELPIGDHNYVIAEDGYNSIDGIARLNANSPRIITETLMRTSMPQSGGSTSQQPTHTESQSTASQSAVVIATAQHPTIESITVNGVSFNMVRVEGGTFMMGSNDSEANDDEKPVHQVTLSSYSIGETEVTQELWQAVMGRNPSEFKGSNLPAEHVSWEDCQEFIRKLNQMTSRKFRLPTEEEWEFAARGGNRSRGYMYSGGNNVDDVAWYSGNIDSKTHIVKTKQANELGLYDMSGNVWEWCNDWYGSYSSLSLRNPTGLASGGCRVIRGGGWNLYAWYCRVSLRGSLNPTYRYSYLGLRLAL